MRATGTEIAFKIWADDRNARERASGEKGPSLTGWMGGAAMTTLTNEELANIGREWLRIVALAKNEDIVVEHDHVRFRDTDLSIKGGALLGFAGLMLAADLVLLSAGPDSFIGPQKSCGYVGLAGLFLLMAGSFCAVLSIMISRKGTYQTAWSSFGLMKLYHDRRRRWLLGSAWLIAAGTLVYLVSLLGQVCFGRCL